jgi:hypothetical protein
METISLKRATTVVINNLSHLVREAMKKRNCGWDEVRIEQGSVFLVSSVGSVVAVD